jgi:hypothetical protein
MKKLVREPLVHFLLIGAGMFLLFGWRSAPAPGAGGLPALVSSSIVVTQGDIDQMVATFTKTWQRQPEKQEVKNLVEDFVRSEIYYREAMSIGLDRDDAVIKRRMRQKMEFILEDITTQAEPSEGELRGYLQKHADAYLTEPRIAFLHVFISTSRRGAGAEADARQALTLLRGGADPISVGDPTALEFEIPLSSLREVNSQFGGEFGTKVFEIEPGTWAGPLPSAFGLHLVQVANRTEGKIPEFADVFEQLKRDWTIDRQNELKNAAYAKLLERYSVTVQTRPVPTASAPSAIGAVQ